MGNNEAENTPDSGSGKKSAFHISKDPVVYGKAGEDVHKYEATIGEPTHGYPEPPAYEDLGTLPTGYGSKSLFLIARDPRWLFSYWDIDWHGYPPSLMQGGKVILRVYNADGAEVYAADVNPEARNWYVPVSQGNASFYAEIGFVNQDGAWEVIARSNDAATPSDSVSEEVSDCFATLPYHLAFQKMLDMVKGSMEQGESLLSALSRIQGEGRKLLFLLGAAPSWTDEQRRMLAAFLGNDLSEILALGSAEIDVLLRKQLQEQLFSEITSSWGGQGLIPEESSLFSAFGAFGSWKEVSSWVAAGETSLLSSWLGAWGGKQEVLSSWLASWGGARETAFWSSFLGSWSGARQRSALSSWLASWAGAGETAALSSWLASWSGVKEVSFWSSYLSSWSGGRETVALSSWLASWGGVTEISSLSSWLASWSGVGQASFWSSWLSSWVGVSGQETLSSWLASWVGVKQSAFWSSWLSSWAGAQVGVGSQLSSWSGVQAGLSSWLSSWSVGRFEFSSALSSWGEVKQSAFWSSFLSSWPAAAGASETAAFWSSWLSSWPGAAGASENAFWSSWLSSWSGAVSPSSAFGSSEFGASWSAQPFGALREFAMILNAEVVFCGGIHPGSKVWIDGKPASISPDGTFRCYVKFPEGDYTIAIVAESPDGKEQRSATLRLTRNPCPEPR